MSQAPLDADLLKPGKEQGKSPAWIRIGWPVLVLMQLGMWLYYRYYFGYQVLDTTFVLMLSVYLWWRMYRIFDRRWIMAALGVAFFMLIGNSAGLVLMYPGFVQAARQETWHIYLSPVVVNLLGVIAGTALAVSLLLIIRNYPKPVKPVKRV